MKQSKEYFELKTQIKELKIQLEELEPVVFSKVVETDDMKLTTDFCRFQIVYRPKWNYTDELKEKVKLVLDKVKILKKEEELNGKARKISDGGQLRMTNLKEINNATI